MKDLLHKNVLLVGATTGMATSGLLYLTSYLYRNGINALCQLRDNNTSDDTLKTNTFRLLIEHQPTLVGVNIKWFQHIARGLRICTLVKSYSPSIKVVVGGNTASYFRYDIIHNENVDYVICGDGELPLLMLCQGKDGIPNFVYKEGRKFTDTLMFDFEIIGVVPYNIYEQSFSGIDLKMKSGFFYCWELPADNLIKLLALKFK